jgi:hypothetical protein
MLIPKENIGEFLLEELEKTVLTKKDAEAFGSNPKFDVEKMLKHFSRNWLASIDWAEQTYGIKINVNPKMLNWVGKIK